MSSPHNILLLFHHSTFLSSLAQFCSLIPPHLWVLSHDFALFIPPLLWVPSHNFALIHPCTFMSSLTQLCVFFIPPLRYLTIFYKFFHSNILWVPSQNFFKFFHRSTFISSCLGGMQARMKNITRLVGLCNKVSGMRKLHYFASTYINCKGTPAMEFFYEFR